MQIIAIVNEKGGTGKTTTTVNFSAALGELGKKVLLVDLDGQAASSRWLGVEDDNRFADALYRGEGLVPIHDVLPGVSLAPGSGKLDSVAHDLRPTQGGQLRKLLNGLNGYDFTVIDCPPSLGNRLIGNALLAASHAIVPVETSILALDGLRILLTTFEDIRDGFGHEILLSGVVACRYDARTRLSRMILQELHRALPGKVFKSVIRENVRVRECPGSGQSIFAYAPDSHAAKDYMSLAREFLGMEVSGESVVLPEMIEPIRELSDDDGDAVAEMRRQVDAMLREFGRVGFGFKGFGSARDRAPDSPPADARTPTQTQTAPTGAAASAEPAWPTVHGLHLDPDLQRILEDIDASAEPQAQTPEPAEPDLAAQDDQRPSSLTEPTGGAPVPPEVFGPVPQPEAESQDAPGEGADGEPADQPAPQRPGEPASPDLAPVDGSAPEEALELIEAARQVRDEESEEPLGEEPPEQTPARWSVPVGQLEAVLAEAEAHDTPEDDTPEDEEALERVGRVRILNDDATIVGRSRAEDLAGRPGEQDGPSLPEPSAGDEAEPVQAGAPETIGGHGLGEGQRDFPALRAMLESMRNPDGDARRRKRKRSTWRRILRKAVGV